MMNGSIADSKQDDDWILLLALDHLVHWSSSWWLSFGSSQKVDPVVDHTSYYLGSQQVPDRMIYILYPIEF
jgi:hypothetical protein